jgi:protein disulfide-isomerase
MSDTSKMKVEIWSDIACPFCYIGKKNYEKALEKFADASNIEIEWYSFQLDPTIPMEGNDGVNMTTYLEQRKGMPASQIQDMFGHIGEMGRNVGIVFNFDKAVIANTIHAHRLLQLAKTKGLSNEAEEILFKAHFTDGVDIGSLVELKSLGLTIGLEETDLDRVLNSDDFSYEVNQDIREGANIGVQGVPFFVFNRRYGISGAQPVDAFLETINKAFSEWKEQANP